MEIVFAFCAFCIQQRIKKPIHLIFKTMNSTRAHFYQKNRIIIKINFFKLKKKKKYVYLYQ